MRIDRVSLLFLLVCTFGGVLAQQTPQTPATTSCTFADGKQISVRYLQPESKNTEVFGKVVPFGQTWKPGGKPILLFTEADLTLSGKEIPPGAYELYPKPGRDEWQLGIARPMGNASGTKEIGTVSLSKGKLEQPLHRFHIYFGRVGDRQCSMRMYWGHTGVWADFMEK